MRATRKPDRLGSGFPDVITLVEEAEAFRQLYNGIRPHEALNFATPITAHLAHLGSHLSEPERVQES